MRIAGLDVGFSRDRPSTGICILRDAGLILHRSPGGETAIRSLLAEAPYEVIAIDGPLLPKSAPVHAVRAVEAVFSMSAFQRRCKPGMSHVAGTGRMLREEAGRAADALAGADAAPGAHDPIPQVRPGQMIVEAFPNCFLGVCVPEADYANQPRLRRGKKFDWLYDRWCERRLFRALAPDAAFAAYCEATTDHEERAALVCALTALCLAAGRSAAVGDARGGWFFLPHLDFWEPWSRAALEQNIGRLREHAIEVVALTRPLLT